MTAEDVDGDRDEYPEPRHPDENYEERPDDVQERVIGEVHCLSSQGVVGSGLPDSGGAGAPQQMVRLGPGECKWPPTACAASPRRHTGIADGMLYDEHHTRRLIARTVRTRRWAEPRCRGALRSSAEHQERPS